MTTFAILTAIASWVCAFRRPPGFAGGLVVGVLVLLGSAFAVLGGLSYWWDRSMMPASANLVVPVCGVLAIVPHAHWIVVAWLENEGHQPFPERPERRRRSDDRP